MILGEGRIPAAGMVVTDSVRSPGDTIVEMVLEKMGLKRKDMYVTAAVKEVLVGDSGMTRTPWEAEVTRHRPILVAEINAAQPAAVLTIGDSAFFAVIGASERNEYGHVFWDGATPIVPMPAFGHPFWADRPVDWVQLAQPFADLVYARRP